MSGSEGTGNPTNEMETATFERPQEEDNETKESQESQELNAETELEDAGPEESGRQNDGESAADSKQDSEAESHDKFNDASGVTHSSNETKDADAEPEVAPVEDREDELEEYLPAPTENDQTSMSTAKFVTMEKTDSSVKDDPQNSALIAEAGSLSPEVTTEKSVAEENPAAPELPPRELQEPGHRDEEPVVIASDDNIPQEQNGEERQNLDYSMKRPVKTLRKWFAFNMKGPEDSNDNFNEVMSELAGPRNQSLAFSRYWENVEDLKSQSTKDRELLSQGANGIKRTFNEIKTGIEYTNDDELVKRIDWEFWSEVINDYSSVLENKSEELIANITKGIPRELRGMVWQVICNSKSMELEEFFRANRNCESQYQKLIKRDLARTSFVTNSAVRTKIVDLYEIIKVYSIYDKEVGYTQGMAFITVPLLMNMEASEAFCMLVKLMNTYDFKQLFVPQMPGLHLKLYQFDRLMEDKLPELYLHLKREGVRSSMYATQWFLTVFGYKFPLEMVLRIYDIVIAEGIESLLKFAINLMMKNQKELLELSFDDLLPFLKDKLFFYYVDNSGDDNARRTLADGYSNREISIDTYKLEDFVADSMAINILPVNLKRYEAEFLEIHKLEGEMETEISQLKTRNGQLLRDIRNIEAAYATLNREHVEIANEMVQGKMEIAHLQDENRQLQEQIDELTERLQRLENQNDTNVDFTGEISNNMNMEIQKTMERNLEVMEENRLLEEQLASVTKELADIKAEISEAKGKWFKKGGFW
ncbi:hypothetical protein KL905_004575 [Ogataea polymorpha]|nr:hypothetical protein KL935_004396 [Ogataea polymorpha]KAG7901057.1 hypothetical protein KL907_004502 [Ogataea polymorpha]KAG7914454.1 hypothetical protein KL927_004648 [Ogataea polymorpha]KAG7916845.1 hypothetical protein KL905_004575 [Ogataea polymorpha]